MKRCSLYHYITNNAKYKSAVIVQLNKEIGSDLSKVLLIFQVSTLPKFSTFVRFASHYCIFIGQRKENRSSWN